MSNCIWCKSLLISILLINCLYFEKTHKKTKKNIRNLLINRTKKLAKQSESDGTTDPGNPIPDNSAPDNQPQSAQTPSSNAPNANDVPAQNQNIDPNQLQQPIQNSTPNPNNVPNSQTPLTNTPSQDQTQSPTDPTAPTSSSSSSPAPSATENSKTQTSNVAVGTNSLNPSNPSGNPVPGQTSVENTTTPSPTVTPSPPASTTAPSSSPSPPPQAPSGFQSPPNSPVENNSPRDTNQIPKIKLEKDKNFVYDIQEVFPASFDSKLFLKNKLEALQMTIIQQARLFCVEQMADGHLDELSFESCILKTCSFMAYLLIFESASPDPAIADQIEQYFDQMG